MEETLYIFCTTRFFLAIIIIISFITISSVSSTIEKHYGAFLEKRKQTRAHRKERKERKNRTSRSKSKTSKKASKQPNTTKTQD
jgi:hypothetical protein